MGHSLVGKCGRPLRLWILLGLRETYLAFSKLLSLKSIDEFSLQHKRSIALATAYLRVHFNTKPNEHPEQVLWPLMQCRTEVASDVYRLYCSEIENQFMFPAIPISHDTF